MQRSPRSGILVCVGTKARFTWRRGAPLILLGSAIALSIGGCSYFASAYSDVTRDSRQATEGPMSFVFVSTPSAEILLGPMIIGHRYYIRAARAKHAQAAWALALAAAFAVISAFLTCRAPRSRKTLVALILVASGPLSFHFGHNRYLRAVGSVVPELGSEADAEEWVCLLVELRLVPRPAEAGDEFTIGVYESVDRDLLIARVLAGAGVGAFMLLVWMLSARVTRRSMEARSSPTPPLDDDSSSSNSAGSPVARTNKARPVSAPVRRRRRGRPPGS